MVFTLPPVLEEGREVNFSYSKQALEPRSDVNVFNIYIKTLEYRKHHKKC